MIYLGEFLAVANGCFQFDFDIYDNYDKRCACAICLPVKLTHEGNEKFLDALTLNVDKFSINSAWGISSLVVDCKDAKEANCLKEFVHSAAGYCAPDDYDKWFIED